MTAAVGPWELLCVFQIMSRPLLPQRLLSTEFGHNIQAAAAFIALQSAEPLVECSS